MKFHFPIKRLHFIVAFAVIVAVLGITKCICPQLGELSPQPGKVVATLQAKPKASATDSIALQSAHVDSLLLKRRAPLRLLDASGKPVKNRVTSVVRFETSFPDLNDVQLATAQRLGVELIANRDEAVRCRNELVYIADNPFYTVQKLNNSSPYLVPRAATLLNTIARAFCDSLATKGYPLHKLIVTSVLRTQEDVQQLRKKNRNASENSCHQYGTTFDISYNRFLEIRDPKEGESEIRYVTVYKSILAEVLEDLRLAGTCYVKYEVHQSCFHITAR